ncbi:hypothetical protein DENIS_1077 [Desulfonema ishimotonii]|uniref:Uncharacterized protein n=1 Tax=Desulfonema ishimotonii TaxID=45657 RepID=A0A401FT34_9BACT|nr:hypothetical protein [Desulfonema ishimotonii]GBC60132.1 hypothetical protein DENIS_1077 [Desulfonema ishimotonii]
MNETVKKTAVKTIGAATGSAGSVGLISSAGSVAGLSAAGITSGLAALGGGSMLGGLVATSALPLAGVACACALYRWFSD